MVNTTPLLLVAFERREDRRRWLINSGQATARRGGRCRRCQKGLGPLWKDTAVVVVTEFGCTARINGTAGNRPRHGDDCLLAGGAIAGGRVIADWPGLKDAQLYQNRDLAPTADLRAALKGVLADHLGLSTAALGHEPMEGLVAG